MPARSNRRLERPREQVLAAALEMIGEQGLAGVTMATLAAKLGTSGGHLLYYFGTKDQLLLETLRWSEATFDAKRSELLARGSIGVDALVEYADLYLPVHRADARWLLWVELWARSPYDDSVATAQNELDRRWRDDLLALVRSAPGDRRPDEVEGWVDRLLAMLDGFSIALVTGGVDDRDAVLDHVRAVAGSIAPAHERGIGEDRRRV